MQKPTVNNGGDVPAIKPDGTDATLNTEADGSAKRLRAKQRCADGIRHAMRYRREDGSENILLNSMCAVVPDFIWPILENKASAADRYTLTWMLEQDSVSIFSTHKPGTPGWARDARSGHKPLTLHVRYANP